MKQKLVVKVSSMHDSKCRSKAMKIAVSVEGVISATIEADKNQIVVVGDGVDSINLTRLLRKRMGSTELISVTPMDVKKEPEKKPEAPSVVPITAWPYQYHPMVPQHYVYEPTYPSNDNCSIM